MTVLPFPRLTWPNHKLPDQAAASTVAFSVAVISGPVANLIITGIVGLIALPGRCRFDVVHQLRSLYRIHAGERLSGVPLCSPASGRAQLNPVSYLVVPVTGAIICAYMLSRLDSNAITLAVSWLVLGIVVLALITHGFKGTSG